MLAIGKVGNENWGTYFDFLLSSQQQEANFLKYYEQMYKI